MKSLLALLLIATPMPVAQPEFPPECAQASTWVPAKCSTISVEPTTVKPGDTVRIEARCKVPNDAELAKHVSALVLDNIHPVQGNVVFEGTVRAGTANARWGVGFLCGTLGQGVESSFVVVGGDTQERLEATPAEVPAGGEITFTFYRCTRSMPIR